MGLHSGTRLPGNVVHNIDPFNIRKTGKGAKNILDLSTWTVSSGTVSGFNMNGALDENSRLLDIGPFGNSALVWQGVKSEGPSGADGGWNGIRFDVDASKMYRFSTWVRRKDLLVDGRFYLGINAFTSAGSALPVMYRSNNTVESTNFYFSTPRFTDGTMVNVALGEWVLCVAHCWPIDSGTGAFHPDSGIYKVDGTRVYNNQDCVVKAGTVKLLHRSYMYYSSTAGDKQQWYLPRVDICDGTEPSLQELLSGFGSGAIRDIASAENYFMQNCADPLANNPPRLRFDGIDDRLYFATSHSHLEDSTIEVVFSVNSISAERKFIAGYKHNPGYGQPTLGAIYIDNGSIRASVITAAEVYRTVIGPTISAGQIYCAHLVKNVQDGILGLFVNGEFYSAVTFDAQTYAQWTTAGTYIGQDAIDIGKSSNETQSWDTSYLNGDIYLFRLYGGVLDDSSIRKNFESIRSRYEL